MEVILKEDYPSLGYVGDRIAVKPGFARNFLLPRGIATEAFSNNARLLKHRLDGINAKRNRLKAEATEVAKRYEGLTLEFKLKMAGQERTFGSITARDIELALKEKDLVVDRRQIKFGEAVKRVGTYQVQIKLHSEVSATVNLVVASDATEKAAANRAAGEEGDGISKDGAAKKKGKGRKSKKAEVTEDGAISADVAE